EFIFHLKEKIMAEKLLIALRNRKQSGASMLEYALLAALITVVCIVSIRTIGNQANIAFNSVGSIMGAANS
ncbi:MAG: Flp family type IVb pilin, partial [Deltaproteobacteria bacterium]|nr:Flp family type IVb pilin [Deltaproteobacteria bacterium]